MKRVLLGGYFGFGNVGDEAILAATLDGLRARLPDAQFSVLSGDPEQTRRAYGVAAANRRRLREVWRELRRADVFVLGGGSLVQDVTSRLSPAYYLGLLSLARLAGTPYTIHAQGVGPLNRGLYRSWTGRAFRKARLVTVRDAESARVLSHLGLTHPEPQVTADPAFCLGPAAAGGCGEGEPAAPGSVQALAEVLLQVGELAGRGPLIGVALRCFPGCERVPQLVAEALISLTEDSGGAVVVLPFLRPDDLEPASEVTVRLTEAGRPAKVVGADATSPAAWAALVARLDLLVAMRLHALVFAVANQVPAVALSYDPKVDAIAADASLPMLPVELASTGDLLNLCRLTLAGAQSAAPVRAEAAERLRRRAADGLDRLAEAIRQL